MNNPVNSDALVVAGDGKIYLASYVGSTPGESGAVSVVNPATLVETPVVALEIAARDMFIESNDDIFVTGMSDQMGAKSLYRLPAGAYASPEVLRTGLGRVWCMTKLDTNIYYSNLSAIVKIPGGGSAETFLAKSVMSLSAASDRLFYADYFGGKIGMINLTTKADSTLLSGLHYPNRVRWVPSTRRLYFVECGTEGAQYKNGTLQVVKGIQ